ncbi:putative nucleic acid-binding Zn-ribbon protein [Halarchaeum solikamskense]|uniref:Zn-ribbon domain-containing protein n=1 Tax=Halarchaeum nitratireducens TaxID=489913 RepID=UPI001B3A9A53|nr:Zn-ribbon containing protein [Halarchaeum solikamskense]MBP2252863.1 putative nucleic acid-binding Zn-ribbon protein [Halarchaeum solikamskense]
MPHQCTNCGHTFADGSKEMLSGCPECGGNKFQFHPSEVPDDAPDDATEEPPERPDTGVPSAVGKAAATVRDLVRDDTPDHDDTPVSDDETPQTADAPETAGGPSPGASSADDGNRDPPDATPGQSTGTDSEPDDGGDDDAEDAAQASARSEMVTADDLPERPPSEGRVVKEPDADADEPDMEALREELNEQFESIKVLAPGQYELNLMELYDREEYIIALQENGRYVIEVPETFAGSERREE